MAKKQNTTTTLIVVAVIAFVAGYVFAQQAQAPTTEEGTSSTEQSGETMMEGDTMMEGETMEKEGETMEGAMMKKSENPLDFTLTGYALDRGGVHLEWVLPENRRAPEKFVIVRSSEPNPEHTGNNYWFRQHGTVREVDWQDVPAGTQNFRICILENDKCVEYSNNVEITVRSAR